MDSTDLKQIQNLSNDIAKLSEFVDALKDYKETPIQGLYIKFKDQRQIELQGNFSIEASNKLINLIIDSRTSLIDKLEKVLKQKAELIATD